MRRLVLIGVVLLVGAALAGAPTAAAHPGGRGCSLPAFGSGAAYQPRIDPQRFGPLVTNAWFPLPPGTTYVYAGGKDTATAVDVVAVSRRTRMIDGVRTRVVLDRLFLNGLLHEVTTDYYAQDACGNVWYFGEDTADLDAHGRVVSRDGTWHAGMHGAQPGVYMQAHPAMHRGFRQEWSGGVAEDQFVAVSRHMTAHVPFGTFCRALRTFEKTALEPGVLDQKIYVRGVGEVLEASVRGSAERLALVDVLR